MSRLHLVLFFAALCGAVGFRTITNCEIVEDSEDDFQIKIILGGGRVSVSFVSAFGQDPTYDIFVGNVSEFPSVSTDLAGVSFQKAEISFIEARYLRENSTAKVVIDAADVIDHDIALLRVGSDFLDSQDLLVSIESKLPMGLMLAFADCEEPIISAVESRFVPELLIGTRSEKRLFPLITKSTNVPGDNFWPTLSNRTRSVLKNCQGTGLVGPPGAFRFLNVETNLYLMRPRSDERSTTRLFQWRQVGSNITLEHARDNLPSLVLEQIRLRSCTSDDDSSCMTYWSLSFQTSTNLTEMTSGTVIASGSDLFEGAGALETFYVHSDTGALEPVQCEESLTAACSALEEARIVMDKETVSIGESWTIGVELGEGQTDGSWVVEVVGAMLVHRDLTLRPGTRRHEVQLQLLQPGQYNLTLSLMFANASLAQTPDLIDRGMLAFDEFFCGQPLGTVSIEVVEKCGTGNEPGYWRLVEKAGENRRFLPEEYKAPIFEWATICHLHWYDDYDILKGFEAKEVTELLILGDSREEHLVESFRHLCAKKLEILHWTKSESLIVGSPSLGEINVKFIRSRGDIDIKGTEHPLRLLTQRTLDRIQSSSSCKRGRKGILLLSIPLWELRHEAYFEEGGIDNYIEEVQGLCPEHTLYFLSMPSVHDGHFLDLHNPETIMGWLPYQNRPRMLRANKEIAAACERTGTRMIDLFGPTDSRQGACTDGVHYTDTSSPRANEVTTVNGQHLMHVLMQIVLNAIFV